MELEMTVAIATSTGVVFGFTIGFYYGSRLAHKAFQENLTRISQKYRDQYNSFTRKAKTEVLQLRKDVLKRFEN